MHSVGQNVLRANMHANYDITCYFDLWLDPGFAKVADLAELLKPYNGTMRRYPVSARVNAVANDDPQCAEPVTLKQATQCGLFESM